MTPEFEDRSTGLIGKLTSIDYPGGYSQTYSYTADDRIAAVTDSFGRQITFEYNTIIWQKFDASGNVTDEVLEEDGITLREPWPSTLRRVNFPDGSYMEYEYDSFSEFEIEWDVHERLISATRYNADGTFDDTESYHYEDERFPFALTGITDAAGIGYANWEYDGYTRATSSVHAGGVDQTLIEYGEPATGLLDRSSRIVTNPLGKTATYSIGDFFARYTISEIEGHPSANCVGDARSISYTNAMVSQIIDKEGRTHLYSRDLKGRITSMTRAAGTPEATSMSATWHPVYRLPLQRVDPGLTTDYSYDADGRLLSMTQTDMSAQGSSSRIWNYTYSGPNVTSIDGPLPGSGDTQFFTYTGPNLTSVTNEVGHSIQITAHNPIGAPLRFTDANGVITRLDYDQKHRLTGIMESEAQNEAFTQISYNATDQVTAITPPNGARLSFFYYEARRLMAIENAVGERIDYTRNAMGGITRTDVSKSGGAIEFTLSQVTDEMNRVIRRIGAGPSSGGLATTQLSYDREDNLTGIIDARNNGWTQSYDGLNRLIKEIDPEGGEVDYGLSPQSDDRNPLTAVTDARDATTNYVRNGFGEIIREVSFEAGITNYTRDARGLITQMTDGRGIVSDYAYDAAGRLLSVSYPSAPEDDITYAYDAGPFGIGQLTTVTENYGVTGYSYNSLGFMTGMTREINGQSYTTSYTYDKAGEILSMTYPSGRIVQYNRDVAARITAIQTRAADEGAFTQVLDNITYAAFGPLTGAGFGDGHNLSIAYDTAYRATSLQRTGTGGALMDIGFDYDAAGDIIAMNDNIRPARSQSFAYDKVSRLTSASGGFGDEGYGSISYGYNLGGDRTSRSWTQPVGDGSGDMSLTEELYIYQSASLRLTEVTANGNPLRTFTYADTGQVISDTRTDAQGTETPYIYGLNARGRVSTVTRNGGEVASYLYDENEQRIAKTPSDMMPIHYHYDDEGRLIAETDGDTGATQREYLWLGLTPVAIYDAANDNDTCDTALLESLNTRLLARQDRLAIVNERIGIVTGNLDERTARQVTVATRKAELEATLASVNPANTDRIARLTARIATLEARLTELDGIITGLNDRLSDLNARVITLTAAIARISARIDRVQARCDAGTGGGAPPASTAALYFLHADHLGRPQFATDNTGTIIWDGGIHTPFGESIATAAAFAQNLMFPGQYQDAESGLSHNWHRTYDPTLGRYLQSDPIGLAGGLNRYAYVGGNPVSLVDPTGEILFVPILIGIAVNVGIDLLIQTQIEGKSLGCVNLTSTLISGGLGIIPGSSLIKPLKAFKAAKKVEKGIGRVVPKFKSSAVDEAINDGLLAGNLFLGTTSLGLEIPKLFPEFTINNNCECR